MKPKKTRQQVTDDYEIRAALQAVSWVIHAAAGVVATLVLFGALRRAAIPVAIVGFTIGLIITVYATRCPLCDTLKSPDFLRIGIFRFHTRPRCRRCDLSDEQVREYVGLLKRGEKVDREAVGRLIGREL